MSAFKNMVTDKFYRRTGSLLYEGTASKAGLLEEI